MIDSYTVRFCLIVADYDDPSTAYHSRIDGLLMPFYGKFNLAYWR